MASDKPNKPTDQMPTEIILAPRFTVGDLIQPNGTLAFKKEALEAKQLLLEEAKSETLVPLDKAAADHLLNLASRINGQIADAEESHRIGKEGFLRMSQAYDLSKREYVRDLEIMSKRIGALIGSYNKNVENERKAADDLRKAELQKAETAKQQILDEASAAANKLAAAASGQVKLKKGEKAKLLGAQLAAETKAEEITGTQEALVDKAFSDAEEARKAKASGGTQRTEYDIVVTDIKALYAAQPTCVRLEPELTQIKWIHRNRPTDKLPGVTITERATFTAKPR